MLTLTICDEVLTAPEMKPGDKFLYVEECDLLLVEILEITSSQPERGRMLFHARFTEILEIDPFGPDHTWEGSHIERSNNGYWWQHQRVTVTVTVTVTATLTGETDATKDQSTSDNPQS